MKKSNWRKQTMKSSLTSKKMKRMTSRKVMVNLMLTSAYQWLTSTMFLSLLLLRQAKGIRCPFQNFYVIPQRVEDD